MLRFSIIVLFAATCTFSLPKDLFGLPESKIVGGQKAVLGQFPHMAQLNKGGVHNCGGAILNNRWIVTAGHCIRSSRPEHIIIRLGTITLDEEGDSYNVDRLVVHPDFDITIKTYDIGLIRTSNEIIFSDNIQPVSIADYEIPVGSEVVISGWGHTKWELQPTDEYLTNDLLFVTVRTISLQECQRRLIIFEQIFDNQICTMADKGKGVCFGDSGGPLIHNGNLIGAVSWGVTCANRWPDVYTKVSSFQDWIDATMAIE